jgi:ADP-ribosylglycohydrolase
MRLAPAVLAAYGDTARVLHCAGESSRTTHGAKECIDACRYFAAILSAVLGGSERAALARLDGAGVVTDPTPRFAEIVDGSYLTRQPPAIRGTGYVLDCLEAALWAFHRTTDFRSGALLAVNLGDDADTTGAVYGQIAGAYYGEGGIPAEWRAKLVMREKIEALADGLHELAGR